ncbi:cutinase family protein [Mycolicibacterium pallens]|uniref:Cutinase n=1 Tax=Mycolicibacterium pallens TaxID=370524 RepID=A0ABX8VLD5_9MYCO|nr:cutinase family protein [Mycolicibacterium pallens]APE18159.1 cutinase family protein [Mycobacterium sp. WY10]QYL16371.1 cutinase family protein [Mycolicibacterium pallens]
MKCASLVVALTAATAGLLGTPPAAHAATCPDIEVVFARGTTEPPGIGRTGQAFVDALRRDLGTKTVGVYAVNYPASTDFPTGVQGVVDGSTHVAATAASCPNTKLVLGGYSQGAAVVGFVTADAIPAGYAVPPGTPLPLPVAVADRVAAVALFGKPSPKFMAAIDEPAVPLGPAYANKTIDLCAGGDPICSQEGGNSAAHSMYAGNGMVQQAADYVARRL